MRRNRINMGLKKTEQKDYAKFLYTEKNFTQKEIAEKAGVTEKTLIKWINENEQEWKKFRNSLMTTKPAQIKMLYGQLERLNETIQTRKIVYDVPEQLLKPIVLKDANGKEKIEYPKVNEQDYPIKFGNFPTSKESDTIVKITNAINKLEGETSIGDMVQVAMMFVEFVRDIDFQQAQKTSELFDMFIRQHLV